MTDQQMLNYVNASAMALGLVLDAAQAQRVAAHLGRTAAMAETLDAFEMPPHDEPAELYCPAPFPMGVTSDPAGERA